jgi:hypothetical protein
MVDQIVDIVLAPALILAYGAVVVACLASKKERSTFLLMCGFITVAAITFQVIWDGFWSFVGL